ncbi:MAG: NADH-quinone oxidoreductase subunit L [Planctomycetota bacterium]
MHDYLWLLPLFPLLGSVACGVLHFVALRTGTANPGTSGPARLAGLVGSGAVGAAFVVSIVAFFQLTGIVHALESSAWRWIDAGTLAFDVAMVVDRLSSVMILVVTGVSFLIHVYSLGYMKGDPGFAKFFAFLNLFVFAMLMLVLSSSLLGLFVGWEGVGLCSYLLIGFWYQKGWPAEAGQKAFVMNRIGDACFLVGSFLLVRLFGSLDLSTICGRAVEVNGGHSAELAIAALLLFGGACGKSAQFPLFTWLPDAMAGPTPVSALIHAATMVTAGVYLLARLNPVYAVSPDVLVIVGGVGALTALIGASTAVQQNDIKKVLAYSTVSQLGYMFLGLASGAWAAAIFHLTTHAFFKGLLFLGAGSVIHGMHDEQDMRRMGGLRRHMPKTGITFVAGAAALSGLPLLSGFFSKDEILYRSFAHGGQSFVYFALWSAGIAAAAMTAFYTWRMVALTFGGEERFDPHHVHPHESPATMTGPLLILAVLATFGGILGLPAVLHVPHLLERWMEPVTAASAAFLAQSAGHETGAHGAAEVAIEWALLGLGAGIALVFAHRGFRAYRRGPAPDEALREKRPALASFLAGAWHVDAAYYEKIVQPVKLFAFFVATLVDQVVIDGAVNGAAALARIAGGKGRRLVDGSVKSYALWMGTGAALLALVWIWS